MRAVLSTLARSPAAIGRKWTFFRLGRSVANAHDVKPQSARAETPRDLRRVSGLAATRVPSRGWRGAWTALLFACSLPALGACMANSYAGIALAAGAADPELQGLARRAQAGDRQAQLELGIRHQEGRGVPLDLERAAQLYRRAAASGDNSRLAYVPGTGGRPASWTILSSGGRSEGLEEASLRLLALEPRAGDHRVFASVAEAGLAEPEICHRLERLFTLMHGTPPSECAAYPFEARLSGGRRMRAYDLVVSIPDEAAAALDYPTNLVDPIEIELIDRSEPVRGRLTYFVVPASGGSVPVIYNFQPER